MRMIRVKCTECKKEFERPTTSRTYVCSTKCKRSRKIRLQRESRKRLNTGQPGRCLHCGEEIPARQKYCKAVACQKARKRANADAAADRYAKAMRSENARQCTECGRWFAKRSKIFVTCGREQCIRARASKSKAESKKRNNEKRKEDAAATAMRLAAQSTNEEITRRIRGIPCPFVGEWTDWNGEKWPALTTQISGYTSMDCPECDPMTNRMEAGVWVNIQQISEVAA